MRITVIVCVVLCLCFVAGAVPAGAQPGGGGVILLVSDAATLDCDFTETVGTLNSIYVVHAYAVDAKGSQFKVDDQWTPYGTAIQLGVTFTDGDINVGNIYYGIGVTYNGGCTALPHTIARLDFFVSSATPPCTRTLSVLADPNTVYTGPVAIDCADQVRIAGGGWIYINGHYDCPCLVGTEPATWSRVKALYQ